MATYYVSPDGSNTSPYDTWAKAATAPKTVTDLVTGAGNTIYVAPGYYAITTAMTLNAAGTAANMSQIIGDYDESITDGGSAKHGRGRGLIIFDGRDTTGGTSHKRIIQHAAADDKWSGWRFKNMVWTSGTGINLVLVDPSSAGAAAEPVEYINMVFQNAGYTSSSFQFGNSYRVGWSDADKQLYFSNCVFISIGRIAYKTNFSGAPTNKPFWFENCVWLYPSAPSILSINAGLSTYYSNTLITDCTFIHKDYGIQTYSTGAGTTKQVIIFQRCTIQEEVGTGALPTMTDSSFTITNVDTQGFEGYNSAHTGWTNYARLNYIVMAYLQEWGDFTDAMNGSAVTAPTPTADIFGTARPATGSSNRDLGFIEYEYTNPPVLEHETPSVGSSGGGPIIGGSIVRRCQ